MKRLNALLDKHTASLGWAALTIGAGWRVATSVFGAFLLAIALVEAWERDS